MTVPKFLYFDLGNVLFHFDHSLVCQQVAEVACLPRGDVEAFFAADHHLQLEVGAISVDELYAIFCEQLGVRPDKAEVVRAASDIFQLNAPIVPLLSRLAMSNHRLGVLSNTSEPHWSFLVSQQYAILPDIFDLAILSYEVQSMKPQAEIYEVAAERAGVQSSEIFFTDDREENIEGALAAGWQAVVFQDAHQLEEELRSRGVAFN